MAEATTVKIDLRSVEAQMGIFYMKVPITSTDRLFISCQQR